MTSELSLSIAEMSKRSKFPLNLHYATCLFVKIIADSPRDEGINLICFFDGGSRRAEDQRGSERISVYCDG